MTLRQNVYALCFVISTLSLGCATEFQTTPSDQESLGKGIVVGSMAEQYNQKAIFTSWPSLLTVKGQVTKIEGAAYLLTTIQGNEIRLPFDQDTTIDRPAHVGDWIRAYTDDSGRARQISNIDEEIIVDDQ